MVLDPVSKDRAEEEVALQAPAHAVRTIGSYMVLEEIGRGGMGVIYRAAHRETGVVVALKTVLPHLVTCTETVSRFQREADAASELFHSNTMPIHEVGLGVDGVPFFTMQLATAGSLYDMRERYRGRWRQIAELMVKVCNAVQHAHDNGILHRDLKPGNILFTEDHEPLVSDFGLAKRLITSSSLTQTAAVLGTPNYVAPEQAAGETKDVRQTADIYSLGAIFFELLTGRPPFIGDSPLDVLRQVREHLPPAPRRLDPTIPKGLETVCVRCLERQPQDRYRSARDLAVDLDLWLQGRKIASRSFLTGFRRGARRHFSTVSWCAGVGALGAGLWLLFAMPRRTADGADQFPKIAVYIESFDQGPTHVGTAREAARELTSDLSRMRKFRVLDGGNSMTRTFSDVFNPAECGRALGAQFVLAGSVRFLSNGGVLWCSGATLRSNQNAVAAFRDLGNRVVGMLQNKWRAVPLTFSRPPPLSSQPEATAFFTRARELTTRSNRRDLETAIALFGRSIELDPHFGEARAMLAYALTTEAGQWGETEKLPLALTACRAAVSCNPYSALSHRALGSCYLLQARYADAIDELSSALQINPTSAAGNMALGDCLREMGQPTAALRWMDRAVKLDPARGEFYNAQAETLIVLGLDEQASVALRRGADLNPDMSDTLFTSSLLRLWQRKFDQARNLCVQARTRVPDDPNGLSLAAMIDFFAGNCDPARVEYEQLRAQNRYNESWRFAGSVNPSSALACLAYGRGETARAQVLIQEALDGDQRFLSTHPHNCRVLHDIAATLSVAGNATQAVCRLKEAIASGWVDHRSTAIDPRFRLLSGNPEFTSLLSRPFQSASAE